MRRGKDRDGEKGNSTLIEEAIMGLTKNLVLEKFPGIQKNDTSKTISNNGEGV